jgi:peptide/nickel transport system substrate-binding protein
MMKMRKSIGGIALAVASITALAACSSSGSSSSGGGSSTSGSGTGGSAVTVPGGLGTVPAAATGTQTTGTATWAISPGASPNWIFPVTPSASNSVYNNFTFMWEMWRPLYWTVNGVVPEVEPDMSLANPPTYTNGDKTVTVSLKSSYKWSNGQPITANDLLFFIDLTKAAVKVSPADWEGYVPGHFPDNLASVSSPNSTTLVMNLKASVNPTWFTDDLLGQGPLVPLPSTVWAKTSASSSVVAPSAWTPATMAKIFNYLTSQSKSLSTYATNPLWQVVDGPYKLASYNTTSGGFLMKPNTTYGGPHAAKMSNFQGVPFTSDTAEFNAVKSGSIDLGYIPQDDVPQIKQVERGGYNVFGEPDFGMNFANYNFKDQTGHFAQIVNQLYFRQAMTHLMDQQGWIRAFMGGAGAPAYGPIPAYPQSPYLPADAATDPYPFSVSAAVTLLKNNGWTVTPGGTDVCAKAGSAAGDCGAGIPAGTKLAFNFIYSTSPALIGDQATDLASKALQAGIKITLTGSNFNYMIANYLDPDAPANDNKWAVEDFGGETDVPYATTFALFNTGGADQIGDYSNPTADALIDASISGGNPAAVKNEASFLTTNEPVMFQPNPDYIWAWKTNISGPPASFENLTQYYATPEYWFFTK